MTGTTLNELLDRQVPGLTKLRIDSYHLDGSDDELMVPDVQSFTINSAGYLLTCPILNTNKASSLRHLCLGAESGVLRHYHEPDGQLQQLHDEWLDGLLDELEDDDEQEVEPTNNSDKLLLQLSTFELKGFDVGKIIKPDSVMLDISSLTSVKLESCHGLEGAFDVLKAEKGKQGLPLRSFHIRQESASPQFRAQLLDFLGSLRGLIHLSVLLETEDPSEPQELEQMLVAPGQSLRSLVWDERRGRRDSFVPQQHISYLSPYQLQAVIARCPNLVELGICIDWRSFTGHVINRLVCIL